MTSTTQAPDLRSVFHYTEIARFPERLDLPLLQDSFALRYQVYCLERGFLDKDAYPQEMESDKYDPQSIHIGALNDHGALVGTVRLVHKAMTNGHFPLLEHCRIDADKQRLLTAQPNVAEISRLAVSRNYRRRQGDGFYGLNGLDQAEAIGSGQDNHDRRRSTPIVVEIYRGMYQVCRRMGITHLLGATERSLQRLLAFYGFPFVNIGPEVDYYGPVRPYVLELDEVDRSLLAKRPDLLTCFVDGLEQEYWSDIVRHGLRPERPRRLSPSA